MFDSDKKLIGSFLLFLSVIGFIFSSLSFAEDNKSFGSKKILDHLWSVKDISYSDQELRVSDYYDPKVTKFDISDYKPNDSLGKEWFGVVRSVDIDQGVRENEKFIALTFDFCELETKTSGYDGRIIDFLRSNNIAATLFLGGKWMFSHQERAMQLIVDPLFEIGNHAWTHGNFAILPYDKMREQILYTQYYYTFLYDKISKLLREEFKTEFLKIPKSQQLFRFPYGRLNDKSLELIRELGLKGIQWNMLGIENKDPTLKDCENFIKNLKNGSIILLHANSVPKYTFNFVKMIVNMLSNLGYKFVTVSELLEKGKPDIFTDGYFMFPGDNLSLDLKYAEYGTMHSKK